MSSGIFIDLVLHVSSNQSLLDLKCITESLVVFDFNCAETNDQTNKLYKMLVALGINLGKWEVLKTGCLLNFSISDIIRFDHGLSESLMKTRRVIDESNRFRNNFIRIYADIRMKSVAGPGESILTVLFPQTEKTEGLTKINRILSPLGCECILTDQEGLLIKDN
nr:VP3 [Cambodia Anopheles rhabdovirus]